MQGQAFGAFGELDEEAKTNPLDLIAKWSPTVQALTDSVTDPVRQASVLRAKLAEALARGSSSRQISVLQAQLQAAERRVQLKQEAEGSVRQFRLLGQLALVTVVGLGGSLIYFVLKRAK